MLIIIDDVIASLHTDQTILWQAYVDLIDRVFILYYFKILFKFDEPADPQGKYVFIVGKSDADSPSKSSYHLTLRVLEENQ